MSHLKRLVMLLAAAALLLSAAWAEDTDAPNAALKITVEKNMHILAAGKTMQLKAVFLHPDQVADHLVAWQVESSARKKLNPKLVKINDKGQLITSKDIRAATNVIVSAVSKTYGTKAEYTVLVYPPVRDFSIQASAARLYAGGKERILRAVTKPAGLARTIAWKVSSGKTARLQRNADGSIRLIPLKAGRVTVTATSKTGIRRQIHLNILQPVTKVTVLGENIVRQKEAIFLRAVVFPKTAFNRDVVWSVDVDSSIATIDQRGRLYATGNAPVGQTITVLCRAKGTDREVVGKKEVLVIYAWRGLE